MSHTNANLMSSLREACKERHSQVRAGWYASRIMEQLLNVEEYKALLLANLWFHQYMESKIGYHLPKEQQHDLEWHSRLKSQYALHDLRSLGVKPFEVPWPNMPIKLTNQYQALGALYVAEGTAIGGALIKKGLLKSTRIMEINAIRFYGCYGKDLSRLWKSFEAFMNEIETTDKQRGEAVTAALSMFDLYELLLVEAEVVLKSEGELALP